MRHLSHDEISYFVVWDHHDIVVSGRFVATWLCVPARDEGQEVQGSLPLGDQWRELVDLDEAHGKELQ